MTDDLYVNGAEAANHLSIVNKAIEGALVIPRGAAGSPTEGPVRELYDGNGDFLTRGGGIEYEVDTPIAAQGTPWLDLARP